MLKHATWSRTNPDLKFDLWETLNTISNKPVCRCVPFPNCWSFPIEGLHYNPAVWKVCRKIILVCQLQTFKRLRWSSVFYSLDTVREEMRLVCLHNDHVKKVSPVFSHHVRHAFVTAQREVFLFFPLLFLKRTLQHSCFMSQSRLEKLGNR